MFFKQSILASAIATASFGGLTAQAAETIPENSNKDPDSSVEEVIVLGNRKASYTEITESAAKLVEMPGSLGDPLGAITALPGVITPSGGGAPAVRGSSPDDNRYYIDGMPAGYIFHQFNTSIFDESVIQDFQLFSAGFGAQYSGATGAVFDVRLRDPKNIEFETTVKASFLRAGVFLESGVTENSAFYLSAREGLIQFFLPEDDEANDEGIRIISAPEDRDYQAKYKWDINSDNSLTILFAGAADFAEAELTDTFDFVQSNPDFGGDALIKNSFNSEGITWTRDMDAGKALSLSLSNYKDKEKFEFGDNYYLSSVLNDTLVRGSFFAPVGNSHGLTFGFEHNDYSYDYSARLVLFICTEFDVDCQDGRSDDVVEDKRVLKLKDSSAYIIDHWQLSNDFSIESGIQWNHNDYTDETFYHPRIAMEWQAWRDVAITSSAGRYNRLPNIENIMPLIGNPQLKSPLAEHYTLGLKGDLGINWNWSMELYHKNLSQLPLALGADQPDAEQLYSNDVEGTARGLDVFFNRSLADKWYGWIALSYSTSERINNRTNETRDYFLDTPVVLNIVANYQISDMWDAGFRLTGKSGQAITKIVGIKPNPDFPDNYLPVYGEPYQDRLPPFMQLDIRAKREVQWFGHDGSFYIDILNVLNRENVESRQLDYSKVNETGELYTEDKANMGILPSIGFSVTF